MCLEQEHVQPPGHGSITVPMFFVIFIKVIMTHDGIWLFHQLGAELRADLHIKVSFAIPLSL